MVHPDPEAGRPPSGGRSVPVGTQTAAVDARLRQIAPHLGLSSGPADPLAGWTHPAGELAAAVARAVRISLNDADVWLAIVGFTATFPTLDEHASVRRALALADPGDAFGVLTALLDALAPIIRRTLLPEAEIEIVTDTVIVDANFSGRSDHNTGVQRVLRETVSRWYPRRELTLACWNERGTGMRHLVGHEIDRVLDWATHSSLSAGERAALHAASEASAEHRAARSVILVPLGSVIVEIEVSQLETAAPLAALAAVSGNRVAVVGHDAIPIVSAQSQPTGEIERFARFLTVVKHSSRVAGVSASAATEYSGFVDAVRAQGVEGPSVVAVPLAMNPPTAAARAVALEPADGSAADPTELPLVLVVGSQEPRKNHSPIVFAAGRLWAEGIRFRIRFIGGGSGPGIAKLDREVRAVGQLGLGVEVLRDASDTVLLDSYREARFTVFPSLHEGFGLPVAESLALGVPVITSNHGSLAEMAEGGGCLTVDPRDDEAIENAMRTLLVEQELYERLRQQAVSRTFRTWNEYAAELWRLLVEPVQQQLTAAAAALDDAVALDAGATAWQPETANTSEASPAALQLALAGWFHAVRAELAAEKARQNSPAAKVRKVGALAKFFVARSREMGVAPATRAAVKIVRRRLIRG
ncbi:hypothetical protein B7R21_04325 [Subtercola boreus]|uniref:Glycosyl transferase family 1 domain-containing protein n=1 Tax=Subtercola boreus TaxID=120213 RepID=A0A3E0W2E6_9MICO|nr:glycosyltransferase [Subtercola boreus]RFA15257.1 hypothetical protein B7R21_04325 [Subtercola boreus]